MLLNFCQCCGYLKKLAISRQPICNFLFSIISEILRRRLEKLRVLLGLIPWNCRVKFGDNN